MCNECWKEFKGWCKAFTKTEILLVVLEAILLILCITFLIFLILHIIVCPSWVTKTDPKTPSPDSSSLPEDTESKEVTSKPPTHTTVDPRIKCTWEPSKKTDADIRYYEGDATAIFALKSKLVVNAKNVTKAGNQSVVHNYRNSTVAVREFSVDSDESFNEPFEVESLAYDEQTDGEEADDKYKRSILALVRVIPPRSLTFGCVLAVISEHWTLTAASCVEAVEEVDSLDNFLIMERYGSVRRGRTHSIADVQLHPLYQGVNRSYDVAALRSEDSLRAGTTPLALPHLADYFLITVGERLTILGFGSYRSVEPAEALRPPRAVTVYVLPGAACRAAEAAQPDAWAPRHLSRGRQEPHAAGGCGAAALCAGVRYGRGAMCGWCAGTPLVRGGALLAVRGGGGACGLTCEPARYANVAALRDWIDAIIETSL